MSNSRTVRSKECYGKYVALRTLVVRSTILFTNFLLILMALYHLKPASRSLYLQFHGADNLPYVWIWTALTMMAFLPFYHRLVARFSRFQVVVGTCVTISFLLILFRLLFIPGGRMVSACFYIFVDIFGVVLVEQFWSLTNSIYNIGEGKRWYGFIGTGGLIGGVVGGLLSAFIIQKTAIQTPGLLLVAALIVCLIAGLTIWMSRLGLYCEIEGIDEPETELDGWRALGKSRYLLLIAAMLLLAQLASPLIDYQFLKTVEVYYPEREARTAFLSFLFSMLSLVSIVINLFVTPFIHRLFGAIGGLLVQPVLMGIFASIFMVQPVLFFAGALKISDRGISYSIYRASKELLYVPIDPVLIYQAKAWIDMFGFRIFKVLGSFLILLCTQWLPYKLDVSQLSWFSIGICILWFGLIMVLRLDYRVLYGKYA
ncbi:MAG: Npt1/Npt2 family nucleotide transporter [Thermodesulfobacteriota bacterium]